MSELAEAIKATRLESIDLLHEVEALWGRSDLSHPPLGVAAYRKKLTENLYKVLVVGEAKRGKSSFVNAVIGKDVLLTDVDIATCQVFRVCRADQEGFRVRYEDGSAQRIDMADLPTYGSQVLADSGQAPALDEVVRWIEVDVPVRFLPEEVELLDTPGLGSLYAGHAEITQRFVPQADGVIFVLGSNHPISDVETQFLERLAEVTKHIFFIQTMIDQHRRADWQSVQQRNASILREKFGGSLWDIEVWPVSSTNLRKAAETGDEDYLKVSRFPELARALRAFLFRTSGWAALAEAVAVAQQCLTEAIRKLDGRRQVTLEQSNTKRREHREQVAAARRSFDEQWGPRGHQRRLLMESIQRHAGLARQAFQQALHPTTGCVAQRFHERIDELKSLDEARALAAKINDEVVAASISQWGSTCETAKSKAREELLPFLRQARSLDKTPSSVDSSGFGNLPAVAEIESQYFDRLKAGLFDGRTASTAVGLPLALVAGFVFPALVPVAIGGAALAFLAGAVRGPLRTMGKELVQTKQQLKAHLTQLLQNVQQRFFAVDQESGSYSVVEEFCRTYVEGIAKSIDEVATEKKQELQAELTRLDDQVRMTEQQRTEEGGRVAALMEEWNRLSERLNPLAKGLGKIEGQIAPSRAG